MSTPYPERHSSHHFQGLVLPAHPMSGTEDDDDDRDDEHSGENEVSVRADNEGTETPEEFVVDYKDRSRHPADDNADEDKDEMAGFEG